MRVLVVEDIPRHANRIAEGLRDQGIAVDVAYDGHEAISKINVNPYDVVLLDRDIPGIHGDHLCQIITHREDPPMILMLTAAGTATDRVTGLALGADDYLPKPFHFPELVLRIRALARRRPAARSRTLRAAGIELDSLTGTVKRDGRRIELSAKERTVLEALLTASPGHSAPSGSSSKPGTRTSIPSRTPSRSPSPDFDANSARPTSSRPLPASATASPKHPDRQTHAQAGIVRGTV
jgi:DNA-binding response OmpR family regulator